MKSNDSFVHNLRSDFHMTQRTLAPVRFSDGLTGVAALTKHDTSRKASTRSECSLIDAQSSLLSTRYCHLITLSARSSTLGGIVRPICFAVLKLMTNSNFVGCSTGSSAGLAPFKILST